MTFRKRTARGKTPFVKRCSADGENAFVQALSKSKARDIEVHCWPHAQWTWTPLSENSILLRRKEEKWLDWGARTRQMGTFPVNRENIRVFCRRVREPDFLQKSGSPKISPPPENSDYALH